MSKVTFGYLNHRFIFDAVREAQESLHTIKVKELGEMILKMNLVKAYDKVNWNFLRVDFDQNWLKH